ncbi:MAG: hypothetical protein HY748_18685 [Elusimicrobia bacterium]|nr:hypothetical protein [Elusimicrobiota bacterium]
MGENRAALVLSAAVLLALAAAPSPAANPHGEPPGQSGDKPVKKDRDPKKPDSQTSATSEASPPPLPRSLRRTSPPRPILRASTGRTRPARPNW